MASDTAAYGFSRPEMYSNELAGTVDYYHRHVFFCNNNAESWPARVEAVGIPKLLASALKNHKNDITGKTRLTICEGGDGTEGDVLIFPDMIRYKDVINSNVDTFVEEVLVKNKEWPSGNPEALRGHYVFVCAHGSRDKRCGACGPSLVKKFKEELDNHGNKVVLVSPCSHIGGHKYAGNVIIFGPNAEGGIAGHWYGYVVPDDVPVLIEQHVGKGEIVDRIWRGQMGLSEEEQQKVLLERAKLCEEVNVHKRAKKTINNEGVGCCQGENSTKCCQENANEGDVKSDNSNSSKGLFGGHLSKWF